MLLNVMNKHWKQHPNYSSYTANYIPFHKPPNECQQYMLGTAGEVKKNT